MPHMSFAANFNRRKARAPIELGKQKAKGEKAKGEATSTRAEPGLPVLPKFAEQAQGKTA